MLSLLMQRYPTLRHLSDRLDRSGKWLEWQRSDARLAHVESLRAARWAYQERVGHSGQVVAALVGIASRRGLADEDAALASLVMLEPGICAILKHLGAAVSLEDAVDHVWEEIVTAAPAQGPSCASFILRRAREEIGLDQRRGDPRNQEILVPSGVPEAAVEALVEPTAELVDLMEWARGRGVVDDSEVELVFSLMSAPANAVDRRRGAYGAAQLALAEQRGITDRTLRRRRARVEQKLRAARAEYLAEIC